MILTGADSKRSSNIGSTISRMQLVPASVDIISMLRMVSISIVLIASLLVALSESAPVLNPSDPIEPTAASLSASQDIKRITPEKEATAAAAPVDDTVAGHNGQTMALAASASATDSDTDTDTDTSAAGAIARLKRAGLVGPKSEHLESQETAGYHLAPAQHQSGYQSATDSDYGHDSGKNSYGKQASDWSLYDQGNHGLYDKYGDKAYSDQGHSAHHNHGKHDQYGNSYNSHGSGHGSGYYSRDRGYGYEKHYAYDKEVASKQHADSHNNYGSQHGLHDNYGNAGSHSHAHNGHDKYGQLSRYGNHGYGKHGSNLAAHHDYGHNQNKGHQYAQSSYPGSYPSYSAHVPTYRSTYSDYSSPQIGYPSSYPSYY